MKNRVHNKILHTLSFKVNISFIIVAAIPMVIYIILNRYSMGYMLSYFEEKSTQQQLRGINEYIHKDITDMKTLIKDYSFWDEAYENVEKRNDKWFRRQFFSYIPCYGIDVIVVENKEGDIIEKYGPVSDGFIKYYSKYLDEYLSSEGNYETNMEPKCGLMAYENKLYMVGICPILKRNMSGHCNGIVILARDIDSEFLSKIENITNNKVFIKFGNNIISNNFKLCEQYSHLFDKINDINIHNVNNKFVISKMHLESIENSDGIDLYMMDSREVFAFSHQWMQSNEYILIGIIIVCLLLLGGLYTKFIIRPMKILENQIKEMSSCNKLDYVKVNGSIEILNVANAFNEMIKRIELQKKENIDLKEKFEYERLKTEFFSNLSHEFRTPLNIIFSTMQVVDSHIRNGLSENLLENNAEKLNGYFTVMKQNCYRLLRLINNLIDVTKIDAGYYELHLRNCNIVSLVEDISLSVAKYAEVNGLTLEFDTNVEEKIIACDSDKIERIILNLLSNAVKFTPKGGKISINVIEDVEKVKIIVKDNGIGIEEKKVNIVFDRFVQVDKSFTRKHEGSGIGLALVKSLVEMHGGTIILKSNLGKGSEFIIELPVVCIKEENENDSNQNYQNCNIEDRVQRISIEFSDIYTAN